MLKRVLLFQGIKINVYMIAGKGKVNIFYKIKNYEANGA